MKTVLFVTYGGGHVKMVVPVALALAASGLARPLVLGLTTAAPVVRAAGLPLLQFKDLVRPRDEAALRWGQHLMAEMSEPVLDAEETQAYLGLCYADLVAAVGGDEAATRYRQYGRQAFLPRTLMQRVLHEISPDLVVATNSPRAEQAAILAARALGLPSVCLVDLFALDEVAWIGQPGYADQICVLNQAVRDFLVRAGRQANEISVTGNPAFDALYQPGCAQAGQVLRQRMGWHAKQVVLWVNQVEPAHHALTGQVGDTALPQRVLDELLQWVFAAEDRVLCVRPRPGQHAPPLPADSRVVLTAEDWELAPLLYAVDGVVTLNSTVGLQAHLVGARMVQVLGSVFDHAMPAKAYGIADEAVHCGEIAAALARCRRLPRGAVPRQPAATEAVLRVIKRSLQSARGTQSDSHAQ